VIQLSIYECMNNITFPDNYSRLVLVIIEYINAKIDNNEWTEYVCYSSRTHATTTECQRPSWAT
jgi:hypothetical protein